jgi:subtilisin family serine protease
MDRIFREISGVKPLERNGIVPGYVAVKLRPTRAEAIQRHQRTVRDASVAPATPDALRKARFRSRIHRSGWTVWRLPKGTNERAFVASLRTDRAVMAAQPLNRIYPLLAEPNDGDWDVVETGLPMVSVGEISFRRLWYLRDIGAYDMEGEGFTGGWEIFPGEWFTAATRPADAPIIAVIDTGVDMEHPDFVNAGGFGTDVAQGGQLIHSLSRAFAFGEIVEGGDPDDHQGHGTHVAGLALASGNNGSHEGKGMIGSGYHALGMVLRVFDDEGTGSDADAAAALMFAADNGAQIINLSLGTENFSQLFQDAVTYAFQKGCLVIVASNEAGNGGGDLGSIYPAGSSASLAVTANGPNFQHASDFYAGTGRYIDIAAPGGNAVIDMSDIEDPKVYQPYIYSTTMRRDHPIMYAFQGGPPPGYDLGYGYLLGTSMATPLVAGAAALYYSYHELPFGNWSNVRTHRMLQRTAVGLLGAPRGSWEPNQGYGVLWIPYLLTDGDPRSATAGTIEGMVYLDGVAAARIRVQARRDGGTTWIETSSQEDGTYRFDQLQPGIHTIRAVAGAKSTQRRVFVMAGCDAPGVDLWAKAAEDTFNYDETPPVVAHFSVLGNTWNGLRIKHWAYDTETTVYRMQVAIGSSPDATDVMPWTEIVDWTPEATVTGPNALKHDRRYFVMARYFNGDGDAVLVRRTHVASLPRLDSAVEARTIPSTAPRNATVRVRATFRNTGHMRWATGGLSRFGIRVIGAGWPVSNVQLPPRSVTNAGGQLVLDFQLPTPATVGSRSLSLQLTASGPGLPGAFGASTAPVTVSVN